MDNKAEYLKIFLLRNHKNIFSNLLLPFKKKQSQSCPDNPLGGVATVYYKTLFGKIYIVGENWEPINWEPINKQVKARII